MTPSVIRREFSARKLSIAESYSRCSAKLKRDGLPGTAGLERFELKCGPSETTNSGSSWRFRGTTRRRVEPPHFK
jgi:hypothetical protein